MRTYKSGTRWCVWRWSEADSQYIRRLHLIKTPWFAICLHWILKPDPEPWLHDHPVTFLSIILRGAYAEKRVSVPGYGTTMPKLAVHKWFNFVRASRYDQHRIIFTRKNTLTLCFMGPVRRTWGFHTTAGWIPWKAYYKAKRDGVDLVENLHLLNGAGSAAVAEYKSYWDGYTVDEDVRSFVVSREEFYDKVTLEHTNLVDEEPK